MPEYQRHSVVDVDTVMKLIEENISRSPNDTILVNGKERKGKHRVLVNNEPVHVSSLRLRTFFKSGTKCACCGLQATHFAIERAKTPGTGAYHLNLWGKNTSGVEVLFTHDHILARCFGGADKSENTQTMCCFCNWAKGKIEAVMIQQIRSNASKELIHR